ncbi:MAG: HAMP domain-containing histidine kinase [Lachnospiraceae bacterium]|nr:HAMP domain-containing histidine kinase [Lachnospiraceae bacterium]
MKRRLYGCLFFLFLLFALAGFVLVSSFTIRLIHHKLEAEEAERLHREALLIANRYEEAYYSTAYTLQDFYSQLIALETYLGGQIWVVDRNGRILVDSSKPMLDAAAAPRIEEFNPADFGSGYILRGTFYDYFDRNVLTVYAPIAHNFNLIGYVLIHQNAAVIETTSYGLLDVHYLTWGILALFVALILLIIAFGIVHPIRKIAHVAGLYAGGELEKKVVVRQNSEIGYLSASLNYMANEMNTLEDDQRKFISNVSHDFRSPLTSIKGYIEAMLDGTIPPEMQERYLKTILFETERLTKLTSGILELNKYGAHGRTILDITSFDINEVIKQTVRAFEGICIEKRISFEVILTDKELLVAADMTKIQQVLYNLIDNAIKFSHHDSVIDIETTLKNEKVFVSVKDHGIGIPKESLGKVFERFYKSDSSRGKDKKGTGLGLSIVKEVIQAHNENINVISTEGVGTEFIFSLPVAREEA